VQPRIEEVLMRRSAEGNTVIKHEFVPRPWGKDNPYGNVFDTTNRTLECERDAAREADGRTGRYWKIVIPSAIKQRSATPPATSWWCNRRSPRSLARGRARGSLLPWTHFWLSRSRSWRGLPSTP